MRTFFFLFPLLAAAQTENANLPLQRIGPNDLLAVSVYKTPELSRTVRVDAAGDITLPLLEGPLRAAGLLASEVETLLGKALRKGGILVNPVVKVTVAEYASRPVTVAGAVRKPVTFQAMGVVTLLDALARAEGLTPDAGAELTVTTGSRPGPIRIPVKSLIDRADPSLNLTLTGGEVIRVPEAGRIFVVGNVRKPGSFPIRDAGEATVLKALALAEGLAPFPAKLAWVTRVNATTGEKREFPVEIEKILQRKTPDVPLSPNDILYVPDNKGRRTTANVIDRVTGFGANTASGVLIWRR